MDWTGLPPLAALRAFAAYAETGSVQKAGDKLNVSHAAISQQIRNLETHLGLSLLDRSGRSAVLTDEGRALAAALDAGFGEISRAVALLTGAEEARPLHVSTTPSFASNWLMPRLADFRARHPEIDIMIDPNPALCDPAPGGVDIAIRYGAGDWPGMDTQLLVPSAMAVVAAPDLIGMREVSGPQDLLGLPWLQELGTTEASRWFADHGITDARSGGMIALPGHLVLEAARSGQGVAVTASIWVAHDIAAGRLRLLFEEGDRNGYHLVTRPGIARPALAAFAKWVRRQASAPS